MLLWPHCLSEDPHHACLCPSEPRAGLRGAETGQGGTGGQGGRPGGPPRAPELGSLYLVLPEAPLSGWKSGGVLRAGAAAQRFNREGLAGGSEGPPCLSPGEGREPFPQARPTGWVPEQRLSLLNLE